MSGQPLQNPLDADKFRREYLNQLKLRAELDDVNLQANKVYKRTGQKNEIQDYRTADEKLADKEGLKRKVRSELQQIMSPQIASEVIVRTNDRDMAFLAQNLEAMIPPLKKMYSVGITEATQFLDFFTRYAERLARTGGVELGLQQSTGQDILLGVQTILQEAVSVEQLREIARMIRDTDLLRARDKQEFQANINVVAEGLQVIRGDISDVMSNVSRFDANVIGDLQSSVDRMTNQLPTKTQVADILNRINFLARAKDVEGVSGKLEELREIITQDDAFGLELRQIRSMLGELIQERAPRTIYKSLVEVERLDDASLKVYISDINKVIKEAGMQRVFGKSAGELRRLPVPEKREELRRADDALRTVLREELEIADADIGDETPKSGGAKEVAGRGIRGCGQTPCSCGVIQGTGLVRSRAYTPKPTDVDESSGVAPSPKYVKLGRYLIHKGKMADDIVSIRRPSGTFVGDFPSQRVSQNLGKVFRSIIGGGVPSFNDLNSLNEEERVYLHKLAKSARIDDKLDIPAPKMEENEKDVRRFEILKGQIMAGQDNREMIKEFKLLLLKLSKKGLIPKGQVKDLLVDLASMGF